MPFMGYYGIFAMLPVLLIGIVVQIRLKNAYSKYSTIGNTRGMTGAMMAEQILRGAGIYDVTVTCISGNLTDHFDPTKKVVALSADVYNGTSIASIGIAAHECGHAIQHHTAYFPIRVRSAVVGITNFSSKLLYFLMLGSFLIYSSSISVAIFNIATICYAVLFGFQLITLPVEFNASSRALAQIEAAGFSNEDIHGVRKVLSAAAMTYVSAAITALWQLLIMLSRSRNRR
jgi:Zn-dependent membrane protease YugP